MSWPNVINGLLFQLTWFGCVMGGAAHTAAWGLVALLPLLGFAARRHSLKSDIGLAAAAVACGFALDSLWIHTGILDYHGASLAPLWIVTLWAGVGFTLNHSLAFFASRPLLGGLLAGAAAPISYLGGERLGGVIVPDPWWLGVITVAWFGLFWLAFLWVGRDRDASAQARLRAAAHQG